MTAAQWTPSIRPITIHRRSLSVRASISRRSASFQSSCARTKSMPCFWAFRVDFVASKTNRCSKTIPFLIQVGNVRGCVLEVKAAGRRIPIRDAGCGRSLVPHWESVDRPPFNASAKDEPSRLSACGTVHGHKADADKEFPLNPRVASMNGG